MIKFIVRLAAALSILAVVVSGSTGEVWPNRGHNWEKVHG